MPFFDQIDPGTVEPWLKTLFWLAGGLFAVVKVYKELTGKGGVPTPLSVAKHEKFVSEEALLQVHGRIKRERDEINASLAALREEDRRLREKLDEEIGDLQTRVDLVPQRTITMLRETKGLLG